MSIPCIWTATTQDAAASPSVAVSAVGPGRAWLAALELPAVSRELAGGELALGQAVSTILPVIPPDLRSSWALTASARPRVAWRCTRSFPDSAKPARA